MKKTHVILFFTFFFAVTLYADSISFGYDAAGNRISRTIHFSQQNTRGNKSAADTPEPFVEVFEGERQVKIYPNPTQGRLAVEITGGNSDDKVRLTLYNLQGAKLQEMESAVGDTRQVDMFDYPSATYILRLQAGEKTTEYKIIKQ